MGKCQYIEDGQQCKNDQCRVPPGTWPPVRMYCGKPGHAPAGSWTLYKLLQEVGLDLSQQKEAENHPSPWPSILAAAGASSAAPAPPEPEPEPELEPPQPPAPPPAKRQRTKVTTEQPKAWASNV